MYVQQELICKFFGSGDGGLAAKSVSNQSDRLSGDDDQMDARWDEMKCLFLRACVYRRSVAGVHCTRDALRCAAERGEWNGTKTRFAQNNRKIDRE